MAFPEDLLEDPGDWFSNNLITAAMIKERITDPLNALAKLPRGPIANNSDATNVTLAVLNTTYLGGAAVTFDVPAGGRTYRLDAKAAFAMEGGTAGHYYMFCAYNPGTSLDRNATTKAAGPTVQTVGPSMPCLIEAVTGLGDGRTSWGNVALDEGTYTASVLVVRTLNGSATDLAQQFSIYVSDAGQAP